MEQFYRPGDTFVPGSRTLTGKYYTSAEKFALEIERIFTRQWLYAGRSEQISAPGEYFLVQVGPQSGSGESGSGESGSGESLIILRDLAGKAHAYYNVCRHRGTLLCTQSSGRFPNSIQCPYHAWTYGLDGRLIGAPLMDEVPEFSKEDYPLFEAALVESEGFLFINLGQQLRCNWNPETVSGVLSANSPPGISPGCGLRAGSSTMSGQTGN
jgi:Rieske 2Fe-2S family protein